MTEIPRIDNSTTAAEDAIDGKVRRIVIRAGCVLGSKIHLKANVYLHHNVEVDHDTKIEEEVDILRNTKIESHAKIGRRVHIGEGVKVGRATSIGKHSNIDSGAKIGANCVLEWGSPSKPAQSYRVKYKLEIEQASAEIRGFSMERSSVETI
ncbi:uncharacterized protein EAF01_006600 [Botrytis porri]|uniref:Uncharacterized protein n=1 Tax=Botrytis porri TaxID=87229 RepID=A0A4Z1KDM9_9HELO|nr:uncharacterized protein EAF01_006600 [Botrytis porri]KAF7903551.1 hypothetical protein EAF01_006600 [Botrytis porri]TGO83770.1 hypothetical protein BPOR_0595g00060 [Botrytis porri]